MAALAIAAREEGGEWAGDTLAEKTTRLVEVDIIV